VRPRFRLGLILLAALLFAACSIAGFASRDPEIESGIESLHVKVGAMLTTLESGAGTPAAAFATHESFYDDVRTEIAALELRAAGQRHHSTLEALGQLEQNLGRLEALHRAGISAAEVPVLRELLDAQFWTLRRLEGSKKRDGKEN
jgi:hypothetical protein